MAADAMRLRTHDVTLIGERVTLRPLTEGDWDLLLAWNGDRELLYFLEGDDDVAYDLAQVQQIYRGVSMHAFCFVASVGRIPIGECWMQEMNLARISRGYPRMDCRRIDLMIGERGHRRRDLGTEMIRLLTSFAFERTRADTVFGCDIADFNIASLRAFQKAGFAATAKIEQPPGRKARFCWDLMIERNRG